MSYIKLRTHWMDFSGNKNNFPILSKAQYIVINSINGFSDVYEDPRSLVMYGYCIDIDTKEHETKTLYYYDKEEAEDALQQLINAFTKKVPNSFKEWCEADPKNPY